LPMLGKTASPDSSATKGCASSAAA
jgi:hypothetical protein